jgi:hypothetical protein
LKEVILYFIPMFYKCSILTLKKHFRAYNAPPSGALVLFKYISVSFLHETLGKYLVPLHVNYDHTVSMADLEA